MNNKSKSLVQLLALISGSLLLSGYTQAASTPLTGEYQTYDTYRDYRTADNSTQNTKSGDDGIDSCGSRMTVNSSNKQFTNNASVDESCMEAYASQGASWVWYRAAEADTEAWGSDSFSATLSANYGNLALYSATEVDEGETDTFDTLFLATSNGALAINSFVEFLQDELADWDTNNDNVYDANDDKILLNGIESGKDFWLQMPDSALTLGSLTGRYALYGRDYIIRCDNPSGNPASTCQSIALYTEQIYHEIYFAGNGTCYVNKISERSTWEGISSNGSDFSKRIMFEDDLLFSTSDTVNATKTKDANGTTIDADWEITACTYSIANTNQLTINISEFDDIDGADSYAISPLSVSSDGKYLKYSGGVVTDVGDTVLPTLFGMKLNTSPMTSIAGKTYLLASTGRTDLAYNVGTNNRDMHLFNMSRLAITFNAQGACDIDMHSLTADTEATGSVGDVDVEFSEPSSTRTTPTCTYAQHSTDPKRVVVSAAIGGTTIPFTVRFSDDYQVVKMGFTGYTSSIAGQGDWELELFDITRISAVGILYDNTGSDVATATNTWLDTKYWLDLGDNSSLTAIIAAFLLL